MDKEWRKGKTTAQRGYDSRWQKARLHYLNAHPLCVYCLKLGITKAACIVDHIKPHKGNRDLFWDSRNWQALCQHCHDSVKQREEIAQSKGLPTYDDDGFAME